MKKLILAIIGLMTFATVHAQQTVIVQHPGILTDLVGVAGALIEFPAALVEGIVAGTAEAASSLIHGSTKVIVTPPPVVAPASAVLAPPPVVSAPVVVSPRVIAPAPVVTVPHAAVVVTPVPASSPVIRPMTTVTTTYRDGTSVSVTRPASTYELGGTVIVPVDPDHRVGSSPFVNPYVYRYR